MAKIDRPVSSPAVGFDAERGRDDVDCEALGTKHYRQFADSACIVLARSNLLQPNEYEVSTGVYY